MTLAIGAVVLAACVLWALYVQVAVSPVCDLTDPPPNAGYLTCAALPESEPSG